MESCYSNTQTMPAPVVSATHTVTFPQPELLRAASRRLDGLLQTLGQRVSDEAAQPGDRGSAPGALQLLTGCVATVACAAAVLTGAQQSASIVPEQWTAGGLANGVPGVTGSQYDQRVRAGCDAVSPCAGSLAHALLQVGAGLSETVASQEGGRVVDLMKQLADGLNSISKLSNSDDFTG